MTDKQVVVLKLKDGSVVVGYFLENDECDNMGRRITLYRPIYVTKYTISIDGVDIQRLESESYFPYSDGTVSIPYSNIVVLEMASQFYAVYYVRTLGELSVLDARLSLSYLKFYEKCDIADAMGDTDSIFVETTSEYKQ